MPPKKTVPLALPAARHWAGKAPVEEPDSSDDEKPQKVIVKSKPIVAYTRIDVKPQQPPPKAKPIVHTEQQVRDDPRLKRLQNIDPTAKRPTRSVQVEEILVDEESEDRRRDLIRQRALQRQKDQEVVITTTQEPIPIQVESSEESSDESEVEAPRLLAKPVYIPKNNRETVLEKERIANEAIEAESHRLNELKERKKESHLMVQQTLQKELDDLEKDVEGLDVDDTDGLNEEEEYEAWAVRELLRIKRDLEIKDKRDKEALDIERRKGMTDEDIRSENKELGKIDVEKATVRFGQKYYHKGVFYNDDDRVADALSNTDTMAPTEADMIDRTALPAFMQKRDFGKKGNTKYTHLVDQDTSQFDAGWIQQNSVTEKVVKRLGGMAPGFDKPMAKKVKTDKR